MKRLELGRSGDGIDERNLVEIAAQYASGRNECNGR